MQYRPLLARFSQEPRVLVNSPCLRLTPQLCRPHGHQLLRGFSIGAGAGSAPASLPDFRAIAKAKNPLNKAVLAWVVFDGAAKGVTTAVRGLLASTQPLEFRP